MEKSRKTLSFLQTVGNLKHLKRTGWVMKGVNEPETVSGHMYRMAIMSMVIPDEPSIDKNHVIKMSLVHDLAEALAGDITPHCGVSKDDKYTRELNALETMMKSVDDESVKAEIVDLWKEYEDQKTAESHYVKDFDQFDMILQAYEYETSQEHLSNKKLEEFFTGISGKFKTKAVQSLDAALKERRDSQTEMNQKS